MRRPTFASIAEDDLSARYKTACDLKQSVNRDQITSAIRRWADGISIPSSTTIRFVDSEAEVAQAAKAAVIAWDAWAATDAWASWTARAARRAAREVWNARAAQDARIAQNTWDARSVRLVELRQLAEVSPQEGNRENLAVAGRIGAEGIC